MNPTECRHCSTTFVGNFCPECGQRRVVTPYSSKIIITLTNENFDFGLKFLSTIVFLFAHPCRITDTFLRGDLTRFVTPLKLFVSIVGLLFFVGLLEIYVLGNEDENLDSTTYLISGVFILYLTVLHTFFFRNFNWLENFFLATYLCSGCLLILFISGITNDVIQFLLPGPAPSNSWVGYMFLAMLLYYVWFNIIVFGHQRWKTFLKTIAIVVITVIVVLGGFMIRGK